MTITQKGKSSRIPYLLTIFFLYSPINIVGNYLLNSGHKKTINEVVKKYDLADEKYFKYVFSL